MKQSLAILILFVAPAWAQSFKMPDLEYLSSRATETVNVTLDQSMLQLASGFLSKDDPDEVEVKKLISKLKGVYVRSFEFEKEGEYKLSDVEAVRAQLKAPSWSRIVDVKGKSENTEIYLQKDGDQIGGLVVLAAEPKELTIVHIDGPLKPEDLSRLGGHLGIPEISKKAGTKKEED